MSGWAGVLTARGSPVSACPSGHSASPVPNSTFQRRFTGRGSPRATSAAEHGGSSEMLWAVFFPGRAGWGAGTSGAEVLSVARPGAWCVCLPRWSPTGSNRKWHPGASLPPTLRWPHTPFWGPWQKAELEGVDPVTKRQESGSLVSPASYPPCSLRTVPPRSEPGFPHMETQEL